MEIKFSSELAEENSQIDLTENTARKESSPLEVYSVIVTGSAKMRTPT